jgi:hypothetical protein
LEAVFKSARGLRCSSCPRRSIVVDIPTVFDIRSRQAVSSSANKKPRIEMPDYTPDARIAASMEDISRYIGEIKQLLQDLSARPDVDNAQLAKIATAATEIQRVIPAMLLK